MKKSRGDRARIQQSRVVFRGRIFRVRRDLVVEPPPPGKPKASRGAVVREIVEHRGSVVVLPVFPDGRILLVRQYRHAVEEFLWELVAGHIEPGEKPAATAHRELLEETGYRARRLSHLLTFYPTPGFLTEKMHLFRATGLRPGRAEPRPDEAIVARAFTPAQLNRMIRRGELRDGKSIAGILLLRKRSEGSGTRAGGKARIRSRR